MAVQINKAALGTVACTTPAGTETKDGAVHTMVRAFPLVSLPGGRADLKSLAQAVQTYMDNAAKIAAGEGVELVGDDGSVIAKAKPNDGLPSKSEKTQEGDKTTVNHGQNMPLTLPSTIEDIVKALNAGIREAVGTQGRAAISKATRKGSTLTGRPSTGVSIAALE